MHYPPVSYVHISPFAVSILSTYPLLQSHPFIYYYLLLYSLLFKFKDGQITKEWLIGLLRVGREPFRV